MSKLPILSKYLFIILIFLITISCVFEPSKKSMTSNISNNPNDDYSSSWSPDSKKIVFVSNRNGNPEIYSMTSDRSNQTRITNNSSSNYYYPFLSTDGEKIVFYSTRDGNREIYIMNSDGSNQTNISNNPSFDIAPSWSPDGKKITFTSSRNGNWEIYSIKLN